MIPEPTDLPPRSRAAWKVLVAQIESLQKQVDLATGRSAKTIASIGVTQASPYVNPNPDSVEEVKISTQPAIPTDLALTSTGAFASQSGAPSASIIPTWNAGEEILFDPDDASAPPLLFAPTSAFEVWYRKTRTAPGVPSGDDAGVDPVNGNVLPDDPVDDSQRHTATTFTSTAIKDLEFSTEYAVKVRAISPSGMPGDFTDEVLITTVAAPIDVLAAPNEPTLTTRLGTITVTETGLTGGGPVPGWLTDYVVEWNNATVWTAVGAIAPGSSFIDTKLTVGASREYRLRARDSLGRLSDPSVSASIVVQGVTGPDIEANSVTANNIEAGAIDGMVITGATVQTDAAANTGVKFDTNGIRAYNTAGSKVFEVLKTGDINITGKFTASSTGSSSASLTNGGTEFYNYGNFVGAIRGYGSISSDFAVSITGQTDTEYLAFFRSGMSAYNAPEDQTFTFNAAGIVASSALSAENIWANTAQLGYASGDGSLVIGDDKVTTLDKGTIWVGNRAYTDGSGTTYYSEINATKGTGTGSTGYPLRINAAGNYGSDVIVGSGMDYSRVDLNGNVYLNGGALQCEALTNEDLNTLVRSGSYYQHIPSYATLTSNYPVADHVGYLEVITADDPAVVNNVLQRFTYEHDVNSSDKKPAIWQRFRTGAGSGEWTPWEQVGGTADTGWTNLNGYASGFTGGGTPGNLQYRVKDGVVYWRGGATGTLPPGTYTTVATIPSTLSYLWPSAVLRSGSAHGGGKAGLWELGTTGIFKFSPDNTTTAGWGALVTSYPLD